MVKYNNNDIGGVTVKKDERYIVRDNRLLKNLVLSSTVLHSGKATSGHSHPGQEEVYFFVSGNGRMIVGKENDEAFDVNAGDVILIPDGAFHRVFNNHVEDLIFNCVFDGKRNH